MTSSNQSNLELFKYKKSSFNFIYYANPNLFEVNSTQSICSPYITHTTAPEDIQEHLHFKHC